MALRRAHLAAALAAARAVSLSEVLQVRQCLPLGSRVGASGSSIGSSVGEAHAGRRQHLHALGVPDVGSTNGVASEPIHAGGLVLDHGSPQLELDLERPQPEWLASPQLQYQRTLQQLRGGYTRDMSQIAAALDPDTLTAAPDKGAAVLEALMSGAAQLQDLQLLRQLLRCMAAAGAPLSATGHTALIRSLAQAGRGDEAAAWLRERVPVAQLSGAMLRALLLPLLQQGRIAQAEAVLLWAESVLPLGAAPLPPCSQLPATAGYSQVPGLHHVPSSSSSSSSSAPLDSGRVYEGPEESSAAVDQPASTDEQALPCLRLMVAASKGTLAAVQAEWSALQQQAMAQLPPGAEAAAWVRGVHVLASYVSALAKVAQQSPDEALALLQPAVAALARSHHASTWARWAAHMDALSLGGAAAQPHGSSSGSSAAAPEPWWRRRQRAAAREWERLYVLADGGTSRQHLDPRAGLPQQVALAASRSERRLVQRAMCAALGAASKQLAEPAMMQLLSVMELLRLRLDEWGADSLFSMRLWQGAPPEALEELLGELLGWGVPPALAHYEHVLEGHALHRDSTAAEAVLDRISAAGHAPLLRTYNRALHGVGKCGDLAAADRIYRRMRAQSVRPDQQTMRALFMCVRMHASNVRVTTARRMAACRPGDRESSKQLLLARSGMFAAAYSQLAVWQGELVAAGLKHSPQSLHHLMAALERLGALSDCMQLASLQDELQRGDMSAHRFALQAAGRRRDMTGASSVAALTARLREGGGALTPPDYAALITSNFWLNQDHQQLLDTVAAMRAAGYEPQASTLVQLLHVYCHNGMWSEALRVLDDVAAGRVAPAPSTGGIPAVNRARRRRHAESPPAGDEADPLAAHDRLWHTVLRKLVEQRVSDTLLAEFVARMTPEQVQRFKVLYNMRSVPGGGLTLQPSEEELLEAVCAGAGAGDSALAALEFGAGGDGEPADGGTMGAASRDATS